MASGVTAGEKPGLSLPTDTCQLMTGVTLAVSGGSGPGLPLLLNQLNDGGGIDGIHDVSEEQPATASAAHMQVTARRVRVMAWRGPWVARRGLPQRAQARPVAPPVAARRTSLPVVARRTSPPVVARRPAPAAACRRRRRR